jgi:hypothetical protein
VPDELYVAAPPMLAVSCATLWLMGKPRQARMFCVAWQEKPGGRQRVQLKARDCRRTPREFLAEERWRMESRRIARSTGAPSATR